MANHDQLKGFDNLNQYSYSEILEQNMIMFFDWGFINKGGYTNVEIPTSGAYGGDFSRLRPLNDRRYTTGRVWEGARKNWVWESGLEVGTPISISGVFVNNTFYPASGLTIDYPNGQIIFPNAISPNSVVRVAHSYKWINVVQANQVPWLRVVQENSHRVDDSNFLVSSGNYILHGQTALQLPLVAVELGYEKYQGYQIGGSQYANVGVKFHVIGEDKVVNRLAHVIGSQKDKTIFMFDSNRMAEDDAFPLTQKGDKHSNTMVYKDLVKYSGDGGYRYMGILAGKLTLAETNVQESQNLNETVFQKTVTIDTQSVLNKI